MSALTSWVLLYNTVSKRQLTSPLCLEIFLVELGLGIHGEPGAETILLSQLDQNNFTNDLVARVCRRLDEALVRKNELAPYCTGLAVMVNNLGSVSQAEMLTICNAVSNFLYGGNGKVFNGYLHSIYMLTGTYMTSLQMKGVSVSVFMLPDDHGLMSQFLYAPTACTAWVPGFLLQPPEKRKIVSRITQPSARASNMYVPHGPVGGPSSPFTPPHPRSAPAPTVSNSNSQAPQRLGKQGKPPGVYAGAKSAVPHSGTGLSKRTEMNILAITSTLQSHSDELSSLDRKTGDGDLGDTGKRFLLFQIAANPACIFF